MSRSSRIMREPGSLFLRMYVSDIEKFGKCEAALISHLDFLDRRESEPGRPLAGPDDLAKAVFGLWGEKKIEEARKNLESLGVIRRHTITTLGKKNLLTYSLFSLDAARLSELLSTGDDPGLRKTEESGNPQNDQPQEQAKMPGSTSPANLRSPSNDKEKKKTTTTSTRKLTEEEIEEFVEAAVAVAVRKINSLHKFKMFKANQLRAEGASEQDLADLAEYRRRRDERRQAVEAASLRAQQADAVEIDAEALAKGLTLLPESLRGRVGGRHKGEN